MKKTLFIVTLLLVQYTSSQITLSHNVGKTPVKTNMFSCSEDERWSRIFRLSDFGVKPYEQFIIKKGQVALSESSKGARLYFNIYSLGVDFPNNTNSKKLLGSGFIGETPIIEDVPKVLDTKFKTSIIVPAGTDRILVTVYKSQIVYDKMAKVLIAGTEKDNDVSWYSGCYETYKTTPTTKLKTSVTNANFYINVTGDVFNIKSSGTTTRLSHNNCEDLIKTKIYGCGTGGMSWSRDFLLKDFGISPNETYTISSAQVGMYYANWGTTIQFRVYEVDDNFPDSFSDAKLLGSSQVQPVSYFGSNMSSSAKIINVDFETPIVVPKNVKRILVEAYQGASLALPAGTKDDDGTTSWVRAYSGGCYPLGKFVEVKKVGYPETKFYVNVTGKVNNVTNNLEMNISNICSEFLKEFSIGKSADIASVIWDFGDPASGSLNTSTDLSPYHDFSADGLYTITATITKKDSSVEILTETIDVREPPKAYGIKNIYACEDTYKSGVSSLFNTSRIKEQVLGGQIGKTVLFIDESGNEYKELPNPFRNSKKDRETIKVRVSHKNIPCCYSETSFDLIVNPLSDLENIVDLKKCDINSDGYEFFDLSEIKKNIVKKNSNLEINFYHENGNLIKEPLSLVKNLIAYEEKITIKVTDIATKCTNETEFKFMVNQLPSANIIEEITACDGNNDGISEYFDTSEIQSAILKGRTGMKVTYFDYLGNKLPTPLPNPYTNIIKNKEIITARITNLETQCYAETKIVLRTTNKPKIKTPTNIYSCDMGKGYSNFNLSKKKKEIIGNQKGLNVIFQNSDNEIISNLESYKNKKPWKETIFIKVENKKSSLCYIKTSFDLVVNELPSIEIEKSYFICGLDPYLAIAIDNKLDSYSWSFQNGEIISTTREVNLVKQGAYKLKIGKISNGILCENSFEFDLVRSSLPEITDVKHNEVSSDNNFIEIVAIGDGDFEYSINGFDYQDGNYFSNISGGIYTVYVRDKKGCGLDSKRVAIVDYPKFFTPNDDGINDTWKLVGLKNASSKVEIYDRYGKLLKTLTTNDSSWGGYFNGSKMPPNTYWFKAKLSSGTIFSGYFALK